MGPVQADEEIGKVDLAEQLSKRWHKNVIDQRRRDFSERRPDNDAYGHIQNVPSHGKFLESFEHEQLLVRSWWVC
jgi:hypothetical protein